jgi:hypothetical protein
VQSGFTAADEKGAQPRVAVLLEPGLRSLEVQREAGVAEERGRIGELLPSELSTTPLPCFLEVLILHDFKSFEPEVLILGDFKSLFPEVLILVDFKSLLMSEMQRIAKFLEVLILGELGGETCTNGWILAGKITRECSRNLR